MTTPKSSPGNVFTAGSQPFTTQDAALAFSLYLAGVPFVEPARPCFNLYDEEILRKLGYRGLTLEEAARQAHAAGKRGTVQYIFQRTPELNELLNSYRQQQMAINDGEGTAVEHLASLIPDAELRLKVAEVVLKMRPKFVNMWKDQVPLIRIPNPGQTTETKAGKSVTFHSPGWKVISLNASAATRKRLRL